MAVLLFMEEYTMNTFMNVLTNNEKTYTENDATAYRTSGSALLDLNFSVPSLRDAAVHHYSKTTGYTRYHGECLDAVDALRLFVKAFTEDPMYTLKWMMYVRHIHLGLGERDLFRMILTKLGDMHPDMALQFIIGTELWNYGRWDDVLRVYFDTTSDVLRDGLGEVIRNQLRRDVLGARLNDSISLLAKWMPSNNTSSTQACSEAAHLQTLLGLSPREYRKTLSMLRKHLDLVERKVSLNQWKAIDYSHVPSKANIKYRNAFIKHDKEGRSAYLKSLRRRDNKINARSMFLYDIVHAYLANREYGWLSTHTVDETLETLWSAQPAPDIYNEMLVIRDGSGSMSCHISANSSLTAQDIADSITLYCAQHNQSEAFKNKFITFSSQPQVVDISKCETLKSKLHHLHRHGDCSNTDIEQTFDLILDTAVKANALQEDLPKCILVISDMQFDQAIEHRNNETVIETCQNKFINAGYTMPRLIFWNVSSVAHNTIPLQKHPTGVILVSGFSRLIVDMVLSQEIDPEKALKAELDKKFSIIDSLFNDI